MRDKILEVLDKNSGKIGHGEEVITESQFDDIAKQIAEALGEKNNQYWQDEKARVIEIIKAEPEFPGEMPQDMFEKINNNKSAMTEALRLAVQFTKQNILKRLGELK